MEIESHLSSHQDFITNFETSLDYLQKKKNVYLNGKIPKDDKVLRDLVSMTMRAYKQ